MNKKDTAVKAVSIRTEIVMFCQRITVPEIADKVEGIIPELDDVIEMINKTADKQFR